MIKRRKLLRVLSKEFGVRFSRQAKGSHEIYESDNGWAVIHICDEIPEGTMWEIVTQLKIDKDEFRKKMQV
jgi:predicted RNA binding protein YcfA (HicA-like mRNA interferase family)